MTACAAPAASNEDACESGEAYGNARSAIAGT